MTALRSPAGGRFARLGGRFARLGGRFARLSGRFARLGGRFARLSGRFARLGGVGNLVVIAVLALVAGAGRIIAPLTVQHVIDGGLQPGTIGPAVAVGTAAVVLAGTASVLLNRRLQRQAEDALAALRRAGLRRVHTMAAARADRTPTADLVARLTSDADQVTTFLQGGGIQFVTNGAQLIIATAILAWYSWRLTIPVLVIASLLLVAMSVMQRQIGRRFRQARQDLSALQVVITESVTGATLIRSTDSAERMRGQLDHAVDRARDSLVRTLTPLHTNAALGEPAISGMTVTILLGGVWWATHGDPAHPRLTPGQIVAMIFLVTFFVRPLQFLVQSLGEAQNALTGWRRARELANTPSADGVLPLPPGPVSIDVATVSARYGDGPLVLHDVSLRVAPGEHVAVVGRTGSGKSTLAKLLTRRLEPAAGTICLGGVPLAQLTDASLAGRVVVVPQDPFLFEGTLAHNVKLGRPGSTDADVLRILDVLGIADWFATLPDGLDTPVGLRGETLSAGERQLVALARTALAAPDLLVLDEATSGLDPATDRAVQRALTVLTRDRTTVAIAHRMSTAESADRVLVLDAGRLVQEGHHDRLAREPGPYAALIAAWKNNPGAHP